MTASWGLVRLALRELLYSNLRSLATLQRLNFCDVARVHRVALGQVHVVAELIEHRGVALVSEPLVATHPDAQDRFGRPLDDPPSHDVAVALAGDLAGVGGDRKSVV